MTPRDKRAALFEYYKRLGNPSWVVKDGQRLFDTLAVMTDDHVDRMYRQMVELERRKQSAAQKEFKVEAKSKLRVTWRSRLPLFLVTLGVGLVFVYHDKTSPGTAMIYGFLAGGYFEELVNALFAEYRK